MSKTASPLQLLSAAVVAAVVSFLVVTLTKGDSQEGAAADGDKARIDALEQRLQEAEGGVQGLRAMAERALQAGDAYAQEMRAATAELKAGLESNSQSVTGLEQLQAQMSQTFAKLSEAYKSLNGRIERNYQQARMMDKRLKALEGDEGD